MISAKNLYGRRSKTEGRTFLKYSSLPHGTRLIEVRVLMVRETPRLNSPCCLDIAPDMTVDGKPFLTDATSIPINLTNLQKLGQLIGDDISTLDGGGRVRFGFKVQANPQSKSLDDAEVMGFDVVGADPAGAGAPEPAAPPSHPDNANRRNRR